jgi:CheY-like chemotaxis protein
MRILLAEDNLINQRVGQLFLKKAGYEVDVASDGMQALEAYRRTRHEVVLMDCQMPELDGFEVTAAIRALPGPQPMIAAVTAYAQVGERERCLEAGMDDYLAKPFRAAELVALVEKGIVLQGTRRLPAGEMAFEHAGAA